MIALIHYHSTVRLSDVGGIFPMLEKSGVPGVVSHELIVKGTEGEQLNINAKWMWNSIVYPLGISITYQRRRIPLVPNGFSINFLLGSLVFWKEQNG